MISKSLIISSVLKCSVILWDILTFPIYLVLYYPWNWPHQATIKGKRSRIMEMTPNSIIISPVKVTCDLREEILKQSCPIIDTIDKLFGYAVAKHKNKKCLGYREFRGMECIVQENGKVVLKKKQGTEYIWLSYTEVLEKVQQFGRGMLERGFPENEFVGIFAETRMEWQISALGCFSSCRPLITLYPNLGSEAIIQAVNQTRLRTIITSRELISKVLDILPKVPNLKNIISLDSDIDEATKIRIPNAINLGFFNDIIIAGNNSVHVTSKPRPNDLAVIMFTSGSTGCPKGAKLEHVHVTRAVLSCVALATNLMGEKRSDIEAYLAYLPLAHIFEITQEMTVMLMGVKIGYSSPNTLTDASLMVKPGEPGDATVLKPSVIIAVPLILDRVYKAIESKIKAKGETFQTVIHQLIRYRLFWVKRGFDTPILNKVLFSKFQKIMGERLTLIVGGGAPLSENVHDFLRAVLCIRLAQGYGLTETCGGVVLSDRDDLSTGGIGFPIPNVQIKLESWEDGGYCVDDKEGPKGEIIIGSSFNSSGYFELEDETKSNYITDDRNITWFKSGDIGQLMRNGTLRIIDRKKDLIKLQMGEYVSLGKVESILKVHELVENICVCADPTKTSTVALVVPDSSKMVQFCASFLGPNAKTIQELCASQVVVDRFYKILSTRFHQLEKFERPAAIALIPDMWMPESGLVTAAMKLRRNKIRQRYRDTIEYLYAVTDVSVNQKFG